MSIIYDPYTTLIQVIARCLNLSPYQMPSTNFNREQPNRQIDAADEDAQTFWRKDDIIVICGVCVV